jgi:hypothetical protein
MYRTGADSLVWSSSAYVSRISRLSRIVAQSHRQTGLATDDETSISLRHNCATGPTANTSSPSSACDYCPPSSSTPGTRNDDLASPPLIPPSGGSPQDSPSQEIQHSGPPAEPNRRNRSIRTSPPPAILAARSPLYLPVDDVRAHHELAPRTLLTLPNL